MVTDDESQRISIVVDEEGNCKIVSPVDMGLAELTDILAAALTAAQEQLDENEAVDAEQVDLETWFDGKYGKKEFKN